MRNVRKITHSFQYRKSNKNTENEEKKIVIHTTTHMCLLEHTDQSVILTFIMKRKQKFMHYCKYTRI